MCKKIKFTTEKEAKSELQRIILRPRHKPWKDHVPKRTYKCQHCSTDDNSVFHLTSQITIY
mgnify:CR=1 FL=1